MNKFPNDIVVAILFFILLASITAYEANAQDDFEFRCKVVCEELQTFDDIQVWPFWRANGNPVREDGAPLDLNKDEDIARFWSRLGQMDPVTRNKDSFCTPAGKFQMTLNWRQRVAMAMNPNRTLGGLVLIPAGYSGEELEIRLKPLGVVRGRIRSRADQRPAEWVHVYVNLPVDPKRPAAIDRLVSCGSFDGKIEFRLPEGEYHLHSYGVSDKKADIIDLKGPDEFSFKVLSGETVDLPTIELVDDTFNINRLRTESKTTGRWQDYTEHFGEPAPPWNCTESRGIDGGLETLKGKWVLIDFWGLSCAPCLKKHIPKLIKFYEDHEKYHDQFEVVGVCIAYDGSPANLAELDQKLQPYIENVWEGKSIPYPQVLDTTFKSWERYGIPGLGTAVLIDPEGNLVEGDLEKLSELLSAGNEK